MVTHHDSLKKMIQELTDVAKQTPVANVDVKPQIQQDVRKEKGVVALFNIRMQSSYVDLDIILQSKCVRFAVPHSIVIEIVHEFKQTSANAKRLTAQSFMRALSFITIALKRRRKRDRTDDMKVRVDAFFERVVRRILRNG